MAKTFQDLEREVDGLRRTVRRLQGDPNALNQAAVDELTGVADEDQQSQPTRRGLAGVVAKMERESAADRMHRARKYVSANPDVLRHVGFDFNAIVEKAVPGVTVEQCRKLVREFLPSTETESGGTGEDGYSPFERSRR